MCIHNCKCQIVIVIVVAITCIYVLDVKEDTVYSASM